MAYVSFTNDKNDETYLVAWVSTDPTTSWNDVDTVRPSTSSVIDSISTFKQGGYIHIGTVCDDGTLRYHRFNLTTKSFDIRNEDPGTSTGATIQRQTVSVAVDNAGDIVFFYSTASLTVYNRRVSGSWSGNVTVGGASTFRASSIAYCPTGDRFHFIYTSSVTGFYNIRSLNAGTWTLNGAVTCAGSDGAHHFFHTTVITTGGADYVTSAPLVNQDVVTFLDADSPSPTNEIVTTDLAVTSPITLQTLGSICSFNRTLFIVFSEDTTEIARKTWKVHENANWPVQKSAPVDTTKGLEFSINTYTRSDIRYVGGLETDELDNTNYFEISGGIWNPYSEPVGIYENSTYRKAIRQILSEVEGIYETTVRVLASNAVAFIEVINEVEAIIESPRRIRMPMSALLHAIFPTQNNAVGPYKE